MVGDKRVFISWFEIITFVSVTVVTILTYIMVGIGQVPEYNPIGRKLIDMGGFYVFGFVRFLVAAIAFSTIRYVLRNSDHSVTETIVIFGTFSVTLVNTVNATTDAIATYHLGVPQSILSFEIILFSVVVSTPVFLWFNRDKILNRIAL